MGTFPLPPGGGSFAAFNAGTEPSENVVNTCSSVDHEPYLTRDNHAVKLRIEPASLVEEGG
jgi:hypothetical protein